MRALLHIETLQVDGLTFGAEGAADLEHALREQMTRQLQHEGVVGSTAGAVALRQVVAPTMALPARPDAGSVGLRIAESLGDALSLALASRSGGYP